MENKDLISTYQELYTKYTQDLISSVEQISRTKSQIQTIEAFKLFHFYENVDVEQLKLQLAQMESERDIIRAKKSKLQQTLKFMQNGTASL